MKIDIGPYDVAKRSVPVTFTKGGLTHNRDVNACLDANGAYDATATALRVQAVGRGVEQKIAVGAIVEAPPPMEPPVQDAPADEPAA